MAWPSARYKTAANGGSWIPADMNGVQDQYLRSAGLERDDLETVMAQHAGLTTTAAAVGGAAVRRGKSIIATEEARTNTSYGTHTTPDQVANVVLPTDGLIMIAFSALVKESVLSAARIAFFIGSNQLQRATNAGAPAVQETSIGGGSANIYAGVTSSSIGMRLTVPNVSESFVTTGQVIAPWTGEGGVVNVFAAAGTYTVSVQTKSTSGSVTLKERKLWVKTEGY